MIQILFLQNETAHIGDVGSLQPHPFYLEIFYLFLQARLSVLPFPKVFSD